MCNRLNQPVQPVPGKSLAVASTQSLAATSMPVKRIAFILASHVLLLLIVLLWFARPVAAATLGEMNLNSARGEHLLAEIAVNDVSPAQADSLSVSIGDASLSTAAGLVQTENLPFLWAELRQHNESGWFVQLLSSEPVTDPYNEIIVELAWDGGSYLREYALRFGGTGTTRLTERPAAVVAPAAAVEPAAPVVARANGSSGSTVIRVKRGDTLLQIVRGLQLPSTVTQEQAMWGIYSANTRSFSGSPNQLLAGVKLQIPSMQALAALPQQTALANLTKPLGNQPAAVQLTSQPEKSATPATSTTPAIAATTVTPAVPGVSLRDPSIPLYQPSSNTAVVSAETAVATSVAPAAANLSLTRVIKTDSISDVVSRQESRSRVEQTLDQLNASLADVRVDISGVEDSVSLLSNNLGSNDGKVEELSSLITEFNENQTRNSATLAITAGDVTDTSVATLPVVKTLSVDETAQAASAGELTASSSAVSSQAGSGVTNYSGTHGVSYYVQRFMDSTYIRSLALLSVGLLLALFLVTRQLLVQRRKARQMAAGNDKNLGASQSTSDATAPTSGSGNHVAPSLVVNAAAERGSASVLRQQEDAVDAPTALSWFREHLRSSRVSEQDLVKALRRYPNRQDLRLRLMERYANRQEVESFAQLAREMFHLTRGRNKEWPRAIQLGLALELEMEAMEPHLARPFETADFGVERDIQSPYAGDSTLQFADRRERAARSTTASGSATQDSKPDFTLDATVAL